MISAADILNLGWLIHQSSDNNTKIVFKKDTHYMDVDYDRKCVLITIGYNSYQGVPLNIVFDGYLHNEEDLVMLQHMIRKNYQNAEEKD